MSYDIYQSLWYKNISDPYQCLLKSMTKRGKHTKKGDLPQKLCQQCGLRFAWRKKWERDWEQVRYCSERCRRSAKRGRAQAAQ